MVTREGRVKVLDFGLAKGAAPNASPRDDQKTTAPAVTATARHMVGTVPYMAPEQIRGESVDARTDLFALGIMIYELVTGQRPFDGATPPDVTSSILRDAPVAVMTLREDAPHDLDQIIVRCLEKNPGRRAQTAKDVRNELESLRQELKSGAMHPVRPIPIPATAALGIPSIAVLPFVNRGRGEEDEYFSDGLADEMLNVLTKIHGLRVAARTSAFQFKGRNEDIAAIGQRLNVATVLDGTVRRSGTRVRIAVQLVNVSDGYHLWSQMYDRKLEDIFAVQDDIAQSVVRELRATLAGDTDPSVGRAAKADVAAAVRGRGASAEAHRLYLRGRHLGGLGSRESVAKGIECMQEALELDPGHALASAWLSRAYLHEVGRGGIPVAEGIANAREAAERALKLEPNLAEGHASLGAIRMRYDWDWEGAEASYRRALELSPGNADVVRSVGTLARNLGRQEEAISLHQRAVEQDPLNPTSYLSLGHTYRAALRFPEAAAAYRMALDLAPQRTTLHSHLGLALMEEGRNGEGLAEAELEPLYEVRLLTLAVIHFADNRRVQSDVALQEMIEKYPGYAAFQIAEVYAARREVDAAFEWLERAYVQRDTGLADVGSDPLLRSLHDDPRWEAFLVKMGIRARARQT
jgi:serine/threonine-protein kinase